MSEDKIRQLFESQPKEAFAKTHNAWLAFMSAVRLMESCEHISADEKRDWTNPINLPKCHAEGPITIPDRSPLYHDPALDGRIIS